MISTPFGAALSALRPPRARLVIAVAVAMVVIGGLSVVRVIFDHQILTANDFTQDYVSAKAWLRGDNPYGPTSELIDRSLGEDTDYYTFIEQGQRNPHPPALILLTAPLSLLPYQVARALWLLVSAGLMSGSLWAVSRHVGLGRAPAVAVAAGSLLLPVVQKELVYAQSDGLLLSLMVIAWLALKRGRAGRAGVALGCAVALKVFPIFMLIPLLRRRQFRASGIVSVTALITTALTMLVLGASESSSYLTDVSGQNFDFWRAAPVNISLVSLPFRWLTPNHWRPMSVDAAGIAFVLAAVLVVMCVMAAARTPARASGDAFWAAVPWMLLAAPFAWDFYLVIALPFAVLLVVRAFETRTLPSALTATSIALLVAGGPIGLPQDGAIQLLAYSIPTVGLILAGIADNATSQTYERVAPYVLPQPVPLSAR